MTLNNIKDQVTSVLLQKIYTEIKVNLTVGRKDEDQNEYTEEQIQNFIIDNKENIDILISNMIKDFEEEDEDDELADLLNPEDEWIREYVNRYIEFPDIIQ